ncbi:hypothetical protein ACWIID_27800 [Streptomyces phaeochromogenes]
MAYHAVPGTPEYDVMVRLDRDGDRDREPTKAEAGAEAAARAPRRH